MMHIGFIELLLVIPLTLGAKGKSWVPRARAHCAQPLKTTYDKKPPTRRVGHASPTHRKYWA